VRQTDLDLFHEQSALALCATPKDENQGKVEQRPVEQG